MDQTTRRSTLLKTPSPPKSLLSNLTLPGIDKAILNGGTGSGDKASLQKKRPQKVHQSHTTLQTAAFMPQQKSQSSTKNSTSKTFDHQQNEKTEENKTSSGGPLPSETPECKRALKRLEESGLLSKIKASRASAGVDRERNRVRSGSQLLNKTLLLPSTAKQTGQEDSDEDPEEEEWRQKQIDMLLSSRISPSSLEEGSQSEPTESTESSSAEATNLQKLSTCEELSEERDSGCSTPSEIKRNNVSKQASSVKNRAGTPNAKNSSIKKHQPHTHVTSHNHSHKEKSFAKTETSKFSNQSVSKQTGSKSTSGQPTPSSSSSNKLNSSKLNLEVVTCNAKTYHILRELGRGGSSVVNEVFDPVHKRLFAMKIVDLSQANDGERRAFKNEINLLRKLNECERVVKMHDFEYKKVLDQLVLVMEKGDADLSNVLKSFVDSANNQLDRDVVKFYWKEMLKAVREIHSHGIVHADLKPVNFITVAGKLKLIDFGIANALAPEATSIIKDHQVGTINYMSPEALTNRSSAQNETIVKYNTKSDIWSLGCILYNLVYGYPPFGHFKDLLGKFKAITDPAHKIKFSERAPPVVIDCLRQCLQYDPSKRPTADLLLKHPYLTNNDNGQDLNATRQSAASSTAASIRQNSTNSLLSQISVFTPNRMKQLSRVVEQMSKPRK